MVCENFRNQNDLLHSQNMSVNSDTYMVHDYSRNQNELYHSDNMSSHSDTEILCSTLAIDGHLGSYME